MGSKQFFLTVAAGVVSSLTTILILSAIQKARSTS
jgi:hypothetical protein